MVLVVCIYFRCRSLFCVFSATIWATGTSVLERGKNDATRPFGSGEGGIEQDVFSFDL